MRYRGGYRYQLTDVEFCETLFAPEENIKLGLIELKTDGTLIVNRYYAFDGPSGPPLWISDLPFLGSLYRKLMLPTIIRGSCFHDACYELLRWGLLVTEERIIADQLLRAICLADGMTRFRAWSVYVAVRLGAKRAVRPSSIKQERIAP